jgi:hypothetical protein
VKSDVMADVAFVLMKATSAFVEGQKAKTRTDTQVQTAKGLQTYGQCG